MASGPREVRADRGRRARFSGRQAEWICALWLIARGYRILGFRLKTHVAEIDILAEKGGVIVVVEVKRRASLEEALEGVKGRQRDRLLRAAESLVLGRPSLAGKAIRLDLIALAPGRMPRHIEGAWQGE
ncbi:MAG: YraN family protein [Caulobacteraceae bacterium]